MLDWKVLYQLCIDHGYSNGKKRKIHTTDVETGKEEGNFEEFVAKEGKDEASNHEHDRHNGRADCDLADVYSLEKYDPSGKRNAR